MVSQAQRIQRRDNDCTRDVRQLDIPHEELHDALTHDRRRQGRYEFWRERRIKEDNLEIDGEPGVFWCVLAERWDGTFTLYALERLSSAPARLKPHPPIDRPVGAIVSGPDGHVWRVGARRMMVRGV